jgi:hypothetical protein
MRDRDYLGEFEHIIVLALLRLNDLAYGVTVRQEIESRTQREVSIGAVVWRRKGMSRPTKVIQRRNVGDVQNAFFVSQRKEWRP